MDWKEITAVDATAGDFAEHVEGNLDPRLVVKIENGGVWLDILGSPAGPFALENYRYVRPVTV